MEKFYKNSIQQAKISQNIHAKCWENSWKVTFSYFLYCTSPQQSSDSDLLPLNKQPLRTSHRLIFETFCRYGVYMCSLNKVILVLSFQCFVSVFIFEVFGVQSKNKKKLLKFPITSNEKHLLHMKPFRGHNRKSVK